jgi:hypothetical protein
MIKSSFKIALLPGQAQILREHHSLASGRIQRSKRLVIAEPNRGLRAVRGDLRSTQSVVVKIGN